MGTHIGSGSPNRNIKTFDLLDQIVTVLGAAKLTFLPILSGIGTELFPYGTGNDAPVATASAALESAFDPMQHIGGVHSIYNDSSASANVQFVDDADQSFAGAGGMSMGLFIMPTEALGTARTFISKYDNTGAGEIREYYFQMDTSGNLILDLWDETNDGNEKGTGASDVVVPWIWQSVIATYDGTAGGPEVHLYRNGVDTLAAGTTAETGTFSDMVDTAAKCAIGGEIRAGSVENEFEGRIALPFLCGKELTQANVTTFHNLGKTLLGL